MKLTPKVLAVLLVMASCNIAFGQDHSAHSEQLGFDFWFSLLEIPFLLLCIVYAFLTASKLKGGKFGSGMNLLAWGFIVMAVGHIHMQIDHFFGLNLFNELFGDTMGKVIWVTALIITWTLSAIGFIRIYRASKGK